MNKFQLLLLVGVGGLLAFSGCGSEASETSTVTFKHTDNTVYARLPAEPDLLNPLLTVSGYSRPIWEQIYQPLLAFDTKTLEMIPALVTGQAEINDITEGDYAEGATYTYELRPEARWDNGEPVTVDDVIFTFKTSFNPSVPAAALRSYLEPMVDLRVDPDNPRRFTIVAYRKYLLADQVFGNMHVLPAYIFDPDGLMADIPLANIISGELTDEQTANLSQFAERIAQPEYSRDPAKVTGSGPYRLVSWEAGQYISLTKKDDWWGEFLADVNPSLAAHPDSLVFRLIPDQAATIAAIKDELVDAAAQLDPKDFTELKSNEFVLDHFQLLTPSAMQMYFLGLNNKDPLLSDLRVRRALAHLVDVDLIIESMFFGLAERMVGPFNPSRDYYNRDLRPIPYDLDEARRQLAEAGWEDTNGNGIVDKVIDGERRELELDYLVPSAGRVGGNIAILFQENAQQVGIKVNLLTREFRAMMQEVVDRNYQIYSGAMAQDATVLDDPRQLWHTESDTPSGTNRVGFGDAESDALIDRIGSTLDAESRLQLYLEFQELVYNEQPMIFLLSPVERVVISKRFEASATELRPGFMVNTFKLVDLQQ
ncbi:MAG: hypothetical protein KDC54_12795 [Lewinella sp.]|nr:hypothetical protein [Lewinella sp.]